MVYVQVNLPWYDPAHGNMVMLAVYSAIWVVFNVLYVARRNIEPIKSRGWELSLFSSVYTYATFVIICLAMEGMWHDYEWSCHGYIWVVANLVPFWVLVSAFRAWRLYFNYFASRYFMSHIGVLDENVWVRRFRYTRTNGFAACLLLVICLVSTAAEIGIVESLPNHDVGTFGLVCQEHTKYITVAQGIVASLVVTMLALGLWNVQDVIGLKEEMKMDMFLMVPTFVVWVIFAFAGEPAYPFTSLHVANIIILQWLISTIIMPVVWSYRTQFDAKKTTSSLLNSPEFLNALGLKITKSMSISTTEESDGDLASLSPNDVIDGKETKKETKAIDSERLFRAVLSNATMLRGFEKYAIKSWCVENVIFWLDVQTFKADAAHLEMGPAAKLKQAKRIYLTYVIDSADLMVNIDQKASTLISSEIEKAVMDETYSVDPAVFDLAESQVFHQMLTDTFHKWKQTDDYETAIVKLLSDYTGEHSEYITVEQMKVKVVISQNTAINHVEANSKEHIELKPPGPDSPMPLPISGLPSDEQVAS